MIPVDDVLRQHCPASLLLLVYCLSCRAPRFSWFKAAVYTLLAAVVCCAEAKHAAIAAVVTCFLHPDEMLYIASAMLLATACGLELVRDANKALDGFYWDCRRLLMMSVCRMLGKTEKHQRWVSTHSLGSAVLLLSMKCLAAAWQLVAAVHHNLWLCLSTEVNKQPVFLCHSSGWLSHKPSSTGDDFASTDRIFWPGTVAAARVCIL